MIVLLGLAGLGGWGCAGPPAEPAVRFVSAGIELEAPTPLVQVKIVDAGGAAVAARRVPSPAGTVLIPLRWAPGAAYTLSMEGEGARWETTVHAPAEHALFELKVQAPAGQPARELQGGETLSVPLVEGAEAQLGLLVQSHAAGVLTVTSPESTQSRVVHAGERVVELLPLPPAGAYNVALHSSHEALELPFHVETPVLSRDAARAQLMVLALRFPVEADGSGDLARRPERIDLPSPWWSALLRMTQLGFRPRDVWAPWGWAAVDLENVTETPTHVSVRVRVHDPSGQPATAFTPRVRDGDDGTGALSALLRVPPRATASAVIPIFVDDQAVTPGRYRLVVEVCPLGLNTPLHVEEQSWVVSRGSTWVSLGFPFSLLAAAAGIGLLLRRGPAWLARARTTDLVTVALFSALNYLLGAAATVMGLGVAAALGPFAPLLTGLVDDAFSAALLVTLLTLRPQPGSASALIVMGWLLRAIGLGAFSPTDLLYLGTRVLYTELSLWLFGVTRSVEWRDTSFVSRCLRLGAALSLASLASVSSLLLFQTVLYRLYLAPWYVAMIMVGPAFIYVWLATVLAVAFASSLREVES